MQNDIDPLKIDPLRGCTIDDYKQAIARVNLYTDLYLSAIQELLIPVNENSHERLLDLVGFRNGMRDMVADDLTGPLERNISRQLGDL